MIPYLSKKIRRRAYWLAFQSFVCELSRNDVYDSTSAFGAELNSACRKGKQSVVLAATNVNTRVEVSSTLTNDDFTGIYNLACVTLHA
jgi:hypothetical protein